MPKILVIEDDKDLVETITDGLQNERHVVEVAYNGSDGLQLLRLGHFDLVVLDWQLPEISGIDLLRQFRTAGGNTPVIMLTGRDQLGDIETGLNTGADDYLTKPFQIRELNARVRAMLRRETVINPSSALSVRDIVLDPVKHRVTKGGKDVHLSPREFSLLEFFMRHPDEVFSAETLLSRVWEYESEVSPEGLRVCIRRLRIALDEGELSESTIENVRRIGYRLKS